MQFQQRFLSHPHVGLTFLILAALLPSAAPAAVITVGANGTYATVQVGIAAALILGGDNEVRVQSGTYNEHLAFTQNTGNLSLSGGWDATFNARSDDPSDTTIGGTQNGRVLTATLTGGTLDFAYLTVAGGRAADYGGGMRLTLSGDAYARTHHLRLLLNSAESTGTSIAYGGAAYARVINDAALQFDHNSVTNNTLVAVPGANGAGLYADIENQGNVIVGQNRFADNVINAIGDGTQLSSGAGVHLTMFGAARASLVDNVIENNRLNVPLADSGASAARVFMDCGDGLTCDMGVHRNRFSGNLGGVSQVELDLNDTGVATLLGTIGNCLIEGGEGNGLIVFGDFTTSYANIVNVTVTENSGVGIIAVRRVTVSNSIATANAEGNSSFQASVLTANNWLGGDPMFVDAPNGNFRLSGNSQARDAGTANPPGGVGLFDLDHNARVYGPLVDIGAYEVGDVIFRNGFQ